VAKGKRVTLAQPGIPGFFVTGLFCFVLPIHCMKPLWLVRGFELPARVRPQA